MRFVCNSFLVLDSTKREDTDRSRCRHFIDTTFSCQRRGAPNGLDPKALKPPDEDPNPEGADGDPKPAGAGGDPKLARAPNDDVPRPGLDDAPKTCPLVGSACEKPDPRDDV